MQSILEFAPKSQLFAYISIYIQFYVKKKKKCICRCYLKQKIIVYFVFTKKKKIKFATMFKTN